MIQPVITFYEKCSCDDGWEHFYDVKDNAWYKVKCRFCDSLGWRLTETAENLIEFLEALEVAIPNPKGWLKLT